MGDQGAQFIRHGKGKPLSVGGLDDQVLAAVHRTHEPHVRHEDRFPRRRVERREARPAYSRYPREYGTMEA
jgi:hypothetical protein